MVQHSRKITFTFLFLHSITYCLIINDITQGTKVITKIQLIKQLNIHEEHYFPFSTVKNDKYSSFGCILTPS